MAQTVSTIRNQSSLMIQYLIIVILALILTSCEHVNISYTPKGGLVVYPKAIQLIEPAK